MLETFIWHLYKFILPLTAVSFLFGIISFSFGNYLFKRYEDKGYNIAKIIGIFVTALIYFMTVTISSFLPYHLFKLNSLLSIFMAIFLWLLIQKLLNPKFKWKKEFKKNFQIMLNSEFAFLIISTVYLNIHSFNHLVIGENQMNVGILNMIQNSEMLPIKDFWMSGEYFNYYYFGHIVLSIIQNLCFQEANNFFYALAAFIPASLGIGFYFLLNQILVDINLNIERFKRKLFTLWGASVLMLSSTLTSLAVLINDLTHLGMDRELLLFLTTVRVMPDAIAENFSYSFLKIPIHAHVLGLLVGLVLCYLIYEYFTSKQTLNLRNKYFLTIIIMLGISYLTNSWDFVFYLCLFHFIYITQNYQQVKENLKIYLATLSASIYLPLVISMPWSYFYSPPDLGISFVEQRSSIFEFLGVWGFYLYCIFSSLILTKIYKHKFLFQSLFNLLFIYCMIVLFFIEIVYLKDATGSRFNTYYKFSNQIFLILSLITSISITKIFELSKTKILKIVIVFLFIVTLVGTFYTVRSYVSDSKYEKMKDFSNVINSYDTNLFEGYQYMTKLDLKNKVILEASDLPYTKTNYFSTFLGVQSYLGWPNHEFTWRLSTRWIKIIKEKMLVKNYIYSGVDLEKTIKLINENKIDYILISKAEQDIYKYSLKKDKLIKTGNVIYENPSFILIEIHKK